MNHNIKIAGLVLLIACGVWFTQRDSPPPSKSETLPSASGARRNIMVSPADRPSRDGTPYAKNAERPDTQPVVRGVDKEKLIKSLPQWAATYDHSALQKVKEFVFSADTEVRSAAIDAVVAVGIPEGADVLEDALKTITVPEEIVAVKEKIRFLRLPAASR